MNISKARELRQDRAEILDKARGMLLKAGDRQFSQSEQRAWDGMMREADRLRLDIYEAEGVDAPVSRSERVQRPNVWRDGSGREVRSFGEGDSIYAVHRATQGYDAHWDDLTPGQYFRALFAGPKSDAERRAMSSTGGVGANIPAPIVDKILDRLRERDFLTQAGAQYVPMESASLTITRGSTAAALRWAAEGSTGATTDPTFTSVQLNAKTYRGIVRASNELIQDAADLPDALERELIGGLREVLQRAVIHSTGGNRPTGILNTNGVTATYFGSSNGSAPSSTGAGGWGSLLQAQQRLREDNVPEGRLSVVWSPRTARQFAALRDGQSNWLMKPMDLMGVKYYASNAMPNTFAPTTALSSQSSILMGDFSDLVIGVRLDPQIQILRERYSDSWQTGFLASMRVDATPRRPQSFEVLTRVST